MRLRRDVRGGAAVMLAVMVIPLMLFVGSAVDIARVYTVKARLQQACDAGVLAGRRAMTDPSTSTPLDDPAVSQAKDFFKSNFHQGWFQTTAVTFTPVKTSEAQVSGTALATVPMAVMKMFGFQPIALNVACEARYDVADADIMFVLDQTGSMGCSTSQTGSDCTSYVSNNVAQVNGTYSVNETSSSRIVGLRAAVLNFFDNVTAQADASTNFRFGFVPYNATANVGKLLKDLGYIKTSADYQTRFVADVKSGNSTTTSKTGKAVDCPTPGTRTPIAGQFAKDGNGNYSATVTNVTYAAGSKADNGTCTTVTSTVMPQWNYYATTWPTPNTPLDTSGFIQGGPVDNPAQFDSTTTTWTGCVEERRDSNSNNKTDFSMTSPPKDLDPDTAPTSAADGWAPWWPDVTFARLFTPEQTTDLTRTYFSRPYGGSLNGGMPDYIGKVYNEVACPLAAKRLKDTVLPGNSSAATKATVRSSIENYLKASNGFRPYGTTYHDVGMKWGLRLLSPTGMFAADTVAWSGHNAPNRFIIFLTDGDMDTDPAGDGEVYSEYGMEKFDKRVGNGATGSALDNYHNKRFLAECQLAKNRNIKIFVIAYAQTMTPELTTCATPGQAYYASDQSSLNTAFVAIAKQVAMLRISK